MGQSNMGMQMRKLAKKVCLFMICGTFLAGCGLAENDETGLRTEQTEAITEKNYQELNWPESEIALMLPVPESNLGKVEWESSDEFAILVAETPKAKFNDYADACYKGGFNVNCQRGSDYFYAENENKYRLSLNSKDDNVMLIQIKAADDHKIFGSNLKKIWMAVKKISL